MTTTLEDLSARFCIGVTRTQAKNFYYGIRLLPRERREALCAIYAYAREIDDVADGDWTDEAKYRELARLREQLDDLGQYTDPRCRALGRATKRYPIPLEAISELVDGVTHDVAEITYKTNAETIDYCDKVAGTIGRLCVSVMCTNERQLASALAHKMWVGMQLVNIIRDVTEDQSLGRSYISYECFTAFGLEELWHSAAPIMPTPAFAALIRDRCREADEYLADGLCCLPLLGPRSAAAMAGMAGVYQRLLRAIANDPLAVLQHSVRLSTHEKRATVARAVLGLPA